MAFEFENHLVAGGVLFVFLEREVFEHVPPNDGRLSIEVAHQSFPVAADLMKQLVDFVNRLFVFVRELREVLGEQREEGLLTLTDLHLFATCVLHG